MMKRIQISILLASAFSAQACGGTDGTSDPDLGVADMGPNDPCAAAPANVSITNSVTTDTTWCTGQTVTLESRIYVTGGAVLTIQPGVVVQGAPTSALVVTRGSRLEAAGTAAQPIVFTSANAAGTRAPGDWGGVVLFGRAPNNQSADVVFEGLTAEERHTYGGTDAAHDCGTLRYVRIEFAGEVFAPGKEFNGLTVASCGTGTELSYIQVHRGNDDGIEFFGGTVGGDHLVMTGSDDDALDWDFGYSGTLQYLIAQQLGTIGDNGIEADNDAVGDLATPRSRPVIYNATFLGGGAGAAKSQKILLRRATLGLIRNAIFQDFRGGLVIEPPKNSITTTYSTSWPADLTIEGSIFANVNVPATTMTATGDLPQIPAGCTTTCMPDTAEQASFDLLALVSAAARGNTVGSVPVVTVGAGAVPEFCAATGTGAVSGATTAPGIDAAGLAFAGACAPGTAAASAWYAGWTSYPAN